jgi:hypothetical protein
VVIGFFRTHRVPCDEVRVAELVAALVEIGPEALACQAADLMPEESSRGMATVIDQFMSPLISVNGSCPWW